MLKKCGCEGCYYSKDIEEAIEYLKKRLSLLHRNYQFATEQAIEILIKGYRELEKKECLHCGKNAAAYCESCYQDLISKNAKLQLEIDTYKKARKEFEEEINKANMQVYSKFAKHIPQID